MAVDQRKDLIVLTADKHAQFTMRSLLMRHHALGIRPIEFDIFVHPFRDPGCLRESGTFLSVFRDSYEYALVVFDRVGCGRENDSREVLEGDVESAMKKSGWAQSCAAAIVLDPELEIWIWSDSPQVDEALGWHQQSPDLRSWLRKKQYLTPNALKPAQPKEAMISALRKVRRAQSSSIFQVLAETVSVERCSDAAFAKLKAILKSWFLIA